MALDKQGVNVNFAQGLDTKTDPNQVQMGKMLALENAVFTTGASLVKRNGFGVLTQLPTTDISTLTTLNDNLIAMGSQLYAYSADTDQWINAGMLPEVDLRAQSISRSSHNQSEVDSATTSTDLTCAAFVDDGKLYYQIVDATSGQNIVVKTLISASGSRPRVFILNTFFVIVFINVIAATPHIQYMALPIQNPGSPLPPVDVSSQVDSELDYYDAVIANNTLYVAFNASDVGGAIRAFTVNSSLQPTAANVLLVGVVGNIISMCADLTQSSPVIWILAWDDTSNNAYTMAFNQNLLPILAPTLIFNAQINNMTSTAADMACGFLYEVANVYPATAVSSPFIRINNITQAGVVGTSVVMLRSVGLASKVFFIEEVPYVAVVYGGAFQPTFFITDLAGHLYAKFAPSNGDFLNSMVPNVSINGTNAALPYLITAFLAPLNRTQGSTTPSPIFTQKGVNLLLFNINQDQHSVSEIAGVLNITGGYLWMYDGNRPVEAGFHVFPEDITVAQSVGAGALSVQSYFYQTTYEWTDATGQLHRSAPSIPVAGAITGGNNTNTLQIPTLRLTAKQDVRIVIYRWSTAQQTYYQITSITTPIVNDPTVDTITYVDLLADAAILGNTILYTTGGVLENISAPACFGSTLFKSRLFIVDAEDRNLIWYSKQVLEATPVEMSDLQTIFVAPSASAIGSSGPIIALSSMDDKLIIFKRDAIYYVTGNGPDATGANNDFSEPTLVTSTVGCVNPESIVFSPLGLMFQSDKGIWLLRRDLGSQYIGAPVEVYNNAIVKSGLTVPGTNQVRFTLSNGIILMYDYYYDQWGTFNNIPAVSSTLYTGLHTYVNVFGQVRQETPGSYLDATSPVLLNFTTAWFKLTNLQGFQRAYFMYLLATYASPHKLTVGVAYDYNTQSQQYSTISPTNFVSYYGTDPLYGSSSPYGVQVLQEQWQVFFSKQKCQAVQISIQETYDPTMGIPAGAGLTISGLNFVIGAKKGYPTLAANQRTG